MPQPRLSIRSAKARDLARRIARREERSITSVVERALEEYEARDAAREPASEFYARLAKNYASNFDFEALIRESRMPHSEPEL